MLLMTQTNQSLKQRKDKYPLTMFLALIYFAVSLCMFAFINMPNATALRKISVPYIKAWVVDYHTVFTYIFVAVFIVAVLVEYRTVQINAVTLLLAVKCLLDMITLFIEDKLMTHFSVFASSLGMLTSYLIASQVSKGHRFFAWIFILFASVLSLQSLWGMFVSPEPYFSVHYKNHLVIPYGATNIIATALIPTFFLYKKIENKVLKIGYITLVTLGIIATKSRGGMVLFAICLLIKLVLYCKKNNSWKWLYIALGSLAIVFFVLLCFHEFRYFLIGFSGGELTFDALTSGRVTLMIDNLLAAFEKPILGHGLGTYHSANHFNIPQDAHNLFVALLYRCGIVGLTVYIAALALVFRQAKEEKKFTSVWFLFLLIMLANSMFEVCYQSYKCDVIFWFVAGLLNAKPRPEKRKFL